MVNYYCGPPKSNYFLRLSPVTVIPFPHPWLSNTIFQLLEFSVKEGWGPLCAFLGVPVPDVPFPRLNSREEITYKLSRHAPPAF